jgi:hypothetical protein
MDSRFYMNSSGFASSSSNSSPDEKPKGRRAITGAHHFISPSTIRRPFSPEIKESSLGPRIAPQTMFFGQFDRNHFQPMVPMPMQNKDVLPHPSQQVGPPIRYPTRPMVSRNFGIKPGRECKFCRNNGESRDQYTSHVLRNPNTGQLICPVLRSHVCEICGSTGDKAHTRNYCPQVKQEKKNQLAIPVMLKKTMRQSDGQMRQ